MIQKILVVLAVLLASAYLLRLIYTRFFVKKADCDACAFGNMHKEG